MWQDVKGQVKTGWERHFSKTGDVSSVLSQSLGHISPPLSKKVGHITKDVEAAKTSTQILKIPTSINYIKADNFVSATISLQVIMYQESWDK